MNTEHIPEHGEHLIRYYGWYSNKKRGQRAKRQPPAPEGDAASPRPPSAHEARKRWAALIKPGSDIAAALKLAVQSFDPKQQSGKAIVLMSDGEELQGDAIVAAREVATKGVSIFTVGVGSTTGTRIADRRIERSDRPLLEVKYAKNEFGQEVISKLNERVLQQVAVSGRGFYVALGDEGQGLMAISERGLAPLARGTEVRQSKEMREFFQIPLGLCVVLLLGEMLVNERRKGQKVTTA